MLQSIPVFGRDVSISESLTPVDTALKKRMADVALNAARSRGATYTDVRIGRYLNQFIVTRDKNIENTVNTESYGMGIRVIANGSWGFAATDKLDDDGIAQAAALAVQIAKENARLLTEPVQLAPQKGYGEVSWKTPMQKNAFEVPIKEKADLLLAVNDAALNNGASYMSSVLFLVNEQKYFASTDGSYIDQDIHRIWPAFFVTRVDAKSGKFETRQSLSAPMGMGYEYLQSNPKDQINSVTALYNKGYDMVADAKAAAKQAVEKITAK
jgi:TldD protein